jgi:hypothetical protein
MSVQGLEYISRVTTSCGSVIDCVGQLIDEWTTGDSDSL